MQADVGFKPATKLDWMDETAPDCLALAHRSRASHGRGGSARRPGGTRHRRPTSVEDLLKANGYIFAGPENLAALSGELKAFLDRTYYGVLDSLNGRPYAHLIAAGSDGTGAARQLARIVMGWRLKPIAEPVILCTHAQTPEAILAPKHLTDTELAPSAELGAAMATGLALGVF